MSTARKPPALDQYERLGTIGKGSFGVVSRIRRKADGRVLVWKELDYGRMKEKEKQLVVSEVNILRELRHPFIVRYYDRIIDKSATKIYIVQEYCEGGDLGAIIKRCRREGSFIDEELIWKVLTQIVMALRECHRHKESSGALKPILHRDIKPGNVFLDRDKNVKIGDFGLAKELPSESKFAYTNVGTPFYMSPEMINELRYNEKSDIWAVGCLIYEMAALAPPFEASNHLSLAVKINDGRFRRVPSRYSDDLHRAIRWMLHKDSAKRPSVEDLERVPRVRSHSRESALLVREYNLNHQYALRARDLRHKEEELKKREAAVAARESAVSARESQVGSCSACGSSCGSKQSSDSAKGTGSGSSGEGVENVAPDAAVVSASAAMPPPPPRVMKSRPEKAVPFQAAQRSVGTVVSASAALAAAAAATSIAAGGAGGAIALS